jgi:carbamoyl-phosphate synthase small subunit
MEKADGSKSAALLLEDGTFFVGKGFGAELNVVGEAVFTTGMVGYPESMTDPSFAGQVLCFTYPLIGNYGVPGKDDVDRFGLPVHFESESIKVSGLIVQEYCERPSHWASRTTLPEWMKGEGIPGISGIDTRALVSTLREKGVMMSALANGTELPTRKELASMIEKANRYDSVDYVKGVSKKRSYAYGSSENTVVLIDCGVKLSIIRNILKRGYRVVRVPFNASYSDVMACNPDGVVISNGPGDPTLCEDTVKTAGRLVDSEIPLLGICLGEQLIALSQGVDTYKLRYGHRGQNKPVVDLTTGRGYVTSQNHGYAVNREKLENSPMKVWFINADDGSIEGTLHQNRPCIAVQFHPEGSPGPYDTEFVFDNFVSLMSKYRESVIGERIRSMRV